MSIPDGKETLLEARSLTKFYGRVPAVRNVSFAVRPYEVLGYLGPNGSGKSTTVNMITGLLEPTEGEILFDGRNVKEDPVEYKRRIGYVPEIPHLYPFLSGLEYLQLIGRLRSLPPQKLDRRIEDFLTLFSMHEDRHVAISAYSKGMRQKILISAALLHNPDLIIFDEPLSGLDVTSALIFRNLVKALSSDGKIILYSSHVLEVVEKVCSNVIILNKGAIVANDSVERLRTIMSLPNLEDIFGQLVQQEDTDRVARDIVDLMKQHETAFMNLWLSKEERLQIAPLVKHFFGRFFDNELVSAAADAHVSVTQILALLTVPGLFLGMYLMPQYTAFEFMPPIYRERALLADRYLFVSLSMVIVGFATVIEWDALFPDRRDYSILLALPISGRALFSAKIVSLLGFLALFSMAVNLWSELLFPLVSVHRGASFLVMLHWTCAHVGAVLLASAWIFLFFIALQGVLLNLLPLRFFRRISPYVQFVSLAGLVSALLVFPNFATVLSRLVDEGHRGLLLYPPMWFLGLYQVWMGNSRPIFDELARIAGTALVCVAFVSALTYTAGYRGHARKFLESDEGESGAPSSVGTRFTSLLDKAMLHHQLERASFYFVWQALSRSRRHKLYLAAYVGVGTAFVFQGLTALVSRAKGFSGDVSPALLSIQLDLSFFLLSGLRYAITIPAEPAANWIFRMTEDECRRYLLGGTRKFLMLAGIVPVCAALLPVHVMLWGWQTALLHLVFGTALSLILIEALMIGFHKVPFTCYYLPGKSNPTTLGVLYFAAFLTYTYSMTTLEYWILLKPVRMAPFLAAAALVLAAMVWIRKTRVDDDFELVFEDAPEPEIRTLGISLPRTLSSPPAASAAHLPSRRE